MSLYKQEITFQAHFLIKTTQQIYSYFLKNKEDRLVTYLRKLIKYQNQQKENLSSYTATLSYLLDFWMELGNWWKFNQSDRFAWAKVLFIVDKLSNNYDDRFISLTNKKLVQTDSGLSLSCGKFAAVCCPASYFCLLPRR